MFPFMLFILILSFFLTVGMHAMLIKFQHK